METIFPRRVNKLIRGEPICKNASRLSFSSLPGIGVTIGLLTLCGLMLSSVQACSKSGGSGVGSGSETLWIFGASSLQDVLVELGEDFEDGLENNFIGTPEDGLDFERNIDGEVIEDVGADVNLRFQFGGSSSLVHQINEGAPAQILAVANEAVLESLETGQLGDHSTILFAHSQIVIAVPTSNPKNIQSIQDLTNQDLLLGVCAPDVPCGNLAAQVFERAGVGLHPDTREPSARSVLRKLLLGELDAGLIYKVDVSAANREGERLKAIEIDEVSLEARQNNYLAVGIEPVGENDDNPSNLFFNYLTTNRAKKILIAHSFEIPEEGME